MDHSQLSSDTNILMACSRRPIKDIFMVGVPEKMFTEYRHSVRVPNKMASSLK